MSMDATDRYWYQKYLNSTPETKKLVHDAFEAAVRVLSRGSGTGLVHNDLSEILIWAIWRYFIFASPRFRVSTSRWRH